MKVVVLAGGLGTRLAEETHAIPKPMVEIGGMPILWHIMKIYSHYGFNEFIVCLGYKGFAIKEFFADYFLHTSDVTFDVSDNRMEVHKRTSEPWRVTLIETGIDTQTGGRVKRALEHVKNDPVFALTYGDGVGDINIAEQLAFHEAHGKKATVTAVRPASRFGVLQIADDQSVTGFEEKPVGEAAGWISGGFFLLSPSVGDLIEGDKTVWEHGPMEELASSGQLRAYFHRGFWHPMDTMRDRIQLEQQWSGGSAPWKRW